MVDQLKSWFRENQTLVIFLGAQAVALGTAAAAILAYSVKLETRVMIMETRGAPHVAQRLGKIDERLTALDAQSTANKQSIDRIVEILTRELRKPPQ